MNATILKALADWFAAENEAEGCAGPVCGPGCGDGFNRWIIDGRYDLTHLAAFIAERTGTVNAQA